MKSLERIGSGALFALRVITDAFRPPFELFYLRLEVADQGWRSLPLILSSGLALGLVMTLHTRNVLIKFGASAWIPSLQSISFFVEIGPLLAALLVAGRVGAGMGASLAEKGVRLFGNGVYTSYLVDSASAEPAPTEREPHVRRDGVCQRREQIR